MKFWILATAAALLTQTIDAKMHSKSTPVAPCPKADCPAPCNPCCPPVCFERGFPTHPHCTPTAYSEPAATDLRGGWDVFATVSFLYWEALQEGMDLAVPGEATALSPLSGVTAPALGFSVLQQKFKFEPGFKVGLGWVGRCDHWVLYTEYTRLYGNTVTSSAPPTPNVASINGSALGQNGIWIPSSWFTGMFINNITTFISSEWNYGINILDGQISRPFYSGMRFIVEPFFGLRGTWIKQDMHLFANNLPTVGLDSPGANRVADYNSHAIGVGPRIGVNGNWHLRYGFRFMGNVAASLLYTGYEVHQNVVSPDVSNDANTEFPVKTKINDLHALRSNFDLSLGFGWGSYFLCRRMHWDLAATYDFSLFCGQNMMRYLADLNEYTVSALTLPTTIRGHLNGSVSDLFLQGLTIKTQFDF